MAITHNYVDFDAGNDTTGDGSIGAPWKTLQKAFDTLTRNTTDGNQVNLKAVAAHVNAAALDLTTLLVGGALSNTAPLIVRGYTSSANDGGIAEINGNGVALFAATTYANVILADLEIHTCGDTNAVVLAGSCMVYRCKLHRGSSTPINKRMLSLGAGSRALGCAIYDIGTGGNGIYATGTITVIGCYVAPGSVSATALEISGGSGSIAIGNIVSCAHTGALGILATGNAIVTQNAIYNSAAGTSSGVYTLIANSAGLITNNVIVGWSGTGGEAIWVSAGCGIMGYNAFYQNTANYTSGDVTFVDLIANDVTLAANPFTDAANGDFSLTDAAKTALRSAGWPASYLGAHANTDPHVTIGPMQYGPTPGASGSVSISPFRGNIG